MFFFSQANETISSTSPNANVESDEVEDEGMKVCHFLKLKCATVCLLFFCFADDESVTSFPPPPSSSNKSEVIVVGADTTIVNEKSKVL